MEGQCPLRYSFQRDGIVMFVGRTKYASLEANFGGGLGLLFYPIFPDFLPLSRRSSDMTEILLTGPLSLNLIKK